MGDGEIWLCNKLNWGVSKRSRQGKPTNVVVWDIESQVSNKIGCGYGTVARVSETVKIEDFTRRLEWFTRKFRFGDDNCRAVATEEDQGSDSNGPAETDLRDQAGEHDWEANTSSAASSSHDSHGQ